MIFLVKLGLCLFCLGSIFHGNALAGEECRVVVTILPVHSLVASVVEGIAQPDLLVNGAASPHGFSFSPSKVRILHQSQVVVRIGAQFESFLNRTLKQLPEQTRVISLIDAPRLHLRGLRKGDVWQRSDHGHGLKPSRSDKRSFEKHASPGSVDQHFWLDPENAVVLAAYLADELASLWPKHAVSIRENAARLQERLRALDVEITRQIAPVTAMPFLTFHDAYQYFETRYGLRGMGSVSLGPERKPGARRLRELRAMIAQKNIGCIFAEPQFQPKLIDIVIEGSKARRAYLDPIGATIKPGPDHYFQMMRALARSFKTCLGANSKSP